MTKAVVFHLNPDYPNLKRLSKVVDVLSRGGLVIYPTDTYYGLGCAITSRKSITKLYGLKGLTDKHLMSIICPDLSTAAKYAYIDDEAFRVLKDILPGPYTVVLKATKEVPRSLLQKRPTIGIRIPDTPVVLELVQQLGVPIITTTVTDARGEPMTDPEEIIKRYDSHVEAIIEQGILMGDASTVLAYEDGEWEVLRRGKGDISFLE